MRELYSGVQVFGNQKPNFALLKVTVQKSTTNVIQELTDMVRQIVDDVKSLQTQRPNLGSGQDNAQGTPPTVSSRGTRGAGEMAHG